ncbi:hypothetical protein RRG08_007309 [Elysia crispata]|uniref:Uncharacterized protein n=1 Tax=Elysia crispata TaxID=231223 RepID=A0AAE0Z9Y4_9GAST|nr:hypothetical protein RRG08_007309 [Elysia crispata]
MITIVKTTPMRNISASERSSQQRSKIRCRSHQHSCFANELTSATEYTYLEVCKTRAVSPMVISIPLTTLFHLATSLHEYH